MKIQTLIFSLCFASLQCVIAQTEGNLLGTGEWSQTVVNNQHALRGWLLVYDDTTRDAANHARIYLELQHVFQGAWDAPIEILFNPGFRENINFELRDELDRPVPQNPSAIRGMGPPACKVTVPCDAIIRLRADMYTLGHPNKAGDFNIFASGGEWIISSQATNEFFLSGTLVLSNTVANAPYSFNAWEGTLKLPKVKIPTPKPL